MLTLECSSLSRFDEEKFSGRTDTTSKVTRMLAEEMTQVSLGVKWSQGFSIQWDKSYEIPSF